MGSSRFCVKTCKSNSFSYSFILEYSQASIANVLHIRYCVRYCRPHTEQEVIIIALRAFPNPDVYLFTYLLN